MLEKREMLTYQSIEELVSKAQEEGRKISDLVISDQARAMEISPTEIYERMEIDYVVMRESVQEGRKKDLRSMSGLTGGEGYLMTEYADKGNALLGDMPSKAVARAISVAGCNASMGRIVAAPTAGSCGILPGCLISLVEDRGVKEETAIRSMFTSGAFGMVIANKASVAGADGGCQAECGSASAMAAAALTEAMGGTPQQCADACAIALANQLGLVCDPVAGLVEIPCIKRNAAGVVIAFSSADMALAGITARIPADEVIDAMREVGRALPGSLKETAGGGLAATPTGLKLMEQVFGTS